MSQNLSCPQVLLSSGEQLPISHMDVDVSVTVTVATVQIRSFFVNSNSYAVSGLYKAPNNYSQASVTSCDISYPGKRLVTSVIDPEVVTDVNQNPNSGADTFDPLAFSMGFEECPPQSELVVTVNYIQVTFMLTYIRGWID